MNINYYSLSKYAISFLIVVCIAFLLDFFLYLFLPKQDKQTIYEKRIDLDYNVYDIKRLYTKNNIKKIKKIEDQNQDYISLEDIKLKAIYSTDDKKGWVVIKNENDMAYILSMGEKFKKYTLSKIFKNYIIFSKNNKEYKVQLQKKSKILFDKYTKKQDYDDKYDENIIILDDKMSIKRAYLNSYINNSNKIWKSITIKENKNNSNQIDGFKVTSIRKNSVFVSLGLKKGDIIKMVNNIELKSYSDAYKIYQKINSIKNLNMKILRENNEMELNYEIE
jgi:general secretion pathway protein C